MSEPERSEPNVTTDARAPGGEVPLRTTPIARWLVGTILVVYGFSKVNGMQFLMLESELDRPLREVSGFWLTWHYFGYSTPYRLLIALAEIGGGLLLFVPRTSVLGALVLLPVMVNILVLDLAYGIGALPMSVVLVTGLVWILWPHRDRLVRAVLPGPVDGTPAHAAAGTDGHGGTGWHLTTWARGVAMVGILVGAMALQTLIVANTRVETSVTGVWEVEAVRGDLLSHWADGTLYLEANRAWMAVLPEGAEGSAIRHYQVDEAGQVEIRERWLDSGSPLLLEGGIGEDGRLRLHPPGASGDSEVLLRARE